MGHTNIPMAWRQVRVTYIPKPWECEYTEVKTYGPISLSTFLLKTMEILMDRYIRDGVVKGYLVH